MDSKDIALADWFALGIIAFVAMPIVGMTAAVFAFQATHSLVVHVAIGMTVPMAIMAGLALLRGLSKGVAFRLALLAALAAMILLDIGWSA